MASESTQEKIERFILETLEQRESLHPKKRSISEADLAAIVTKKFGDGNIDELISEAIGHLEEGRHKIIRDIQGKIELNIKRRK